MTGYARTFRANLCLSFPKSLASVGGMLTCNRFEQSRQARGRSPRRLLVKALALALVGAVPWRLDGAPDLHVFGNGVEILDGTGGSQENGTHFGVVNWLPRVVHTFTITNSGTTAATLLDPPIRDVAAPFAIVSQPARTVPAHGSTAFSLEYAGGAVPDLYIDWCDIKGDFAGDSTFHFRLQVYARTGAIEISGNGRAITSGSTQPITANGTDFGEVPVAGRTATNIFTIANWGAFPLRLTGAPLVTIADDDAAEFTVTTPPAGIVNPGSSTTFRVVFDPMIGLPRRTTVTVPHDAHDPLRPSPFTFGIGGTGVVPDIDVRGNNISIAPGDYTPSSEDDTFFGYALVARGSVTREFVVRNRGGDILALTGNPRVEIVYLGESPFTVVQQPPATVPPYGTATFRIAYNPVLDYQEAWVNIASTDPDRSVFGFSVGGCGVSPEIDVLNYITSIPDGDTTPGTADNTDFGSVPALSAVTQTFTIYNKGTGVLDLTGNPPVRLDNGTNHFRVTQYPATTLTWSSSTTFRVTFRPLDGGSFSNTVRILNSDLDESPYTFAIRGTGTRPVAVVRGKGVAIADDDTTPSKADDTDFGCVPLGSTVYRTYTVANTGTARLSLTNTPCVAFTGPAAAEFALAEEPWSQIDVGDSTTVRVAFTPRGGGLRGATFVLGNNDPVNPSYAFAVRGLGAAPLTNSAPVATVALTNAYTFNLGADSWHSVACLSPYGKYSLDVYSSAGRTAMLESSDVGDVGLPNFAVLSGRALAASAPVPCATVAAALADGACIVEAERAAPAIQVNRLYSGLRLEAAEPADLYEVALEAGRTYRIRVNPVQVGSSEPAGNVVAYLFNPLFNTGMPSSYEARLDAGGVGDAEVLDYPAMNGGTFALLVTRHGSLSSAYELSVMTGPVPQLLGKGRTIVNGDATPATADGTDFGAGNVAGAAVLHDFTLFNLGLGDLILGGAPPRITFTGTDATSFGVGTMPTNRIAPAWHTSFTLAFIPQHSGLCTATATLKCNDPLTNAYRFAVQGMGFHRLVDAAPAPTALTAVPEYLTFDASGTQWSAVGVKGTPQNRELRLARDPSFANWDLDSKAAGTLTEFVAVEATKVTNWYVRVLGGAAASYNAQMCRPTTSLAAGVAQAGFMGAADVLAVYRADWTAGKTYYVAVDPLPDSPAEQDLSLFVLRPGRSYGSRTAADASANINTSNARESLTLAATKTGTYLVLVVNETLTPATTWSIVAAPAVPDMGVFGNSRAIPTGSTALSTTNFTRFPTLSTAGAYTNTFTIRNSGYTALLLNGTPRVQFDGATPQDFTITTLPASSVALRGGTTTFAVAYRPRGRGARAARVVIPNNQGASYTFAVGGTATGPGMEVESWATGAPVPHGSVAPLVTNDTDFLEFTPGGPWARTNFFLIRNVGEDWLNFTNNPRAVVAGPQAGDFRVIVGGAALPAGEALDLRVAFQPTAVGLRQATVRIPSSDPAHDPFEFAVQGTGVLPRLTKLEDVGEGWHRLYWQSIANAQYNVYRTDSLARGFTGIVTRLTGATPPTNAFYIAPAAAGKPLYLRVKVGRQR